MEKRCSMPDGMIVRLDVAGGMAGDVELDPCLYEEIETIEHCTVHILRCTRCGHIEIEWEPDKDADDYGAS